MDTPAHWVSYYFSGLNTFYIITAVSDEAKNKIKNHYKDKWEKMGLGRAGYANKKTKWVLVKNGKDISDVASDSKNEAAEIFKEKLGLSSLNDYTIENYGYRNLYKVAFLVPLLKDKTGQLLKNEDGEYISDFKNASIYSSDDVPFNNGWEEYFKVIGLDEYI